MCQFPVHLAFPSHGEGEWLLATLRLLKQPVRDTQKLLCSRKECCEEGWGAQLWKKMGWFQCMWDAGALQIGIQTSLLAQHSVSFQPHWNIPDLCSLMETFVIWVAHSAVLLLDLNVILSDGALHLSLAQCFTEQVFSPVSPGKRMVQSPVLHGGRWLEPTCFCANWGNSHFFTLVVRKFIFTLLGFFFKVPYYVY